MRLLRLLACLCLLASVAVAQDRQVGATAFDNLAAAFPKAEQAGVGEAIFDNGALRITSRGPSKVVRIDLPIDQIRGTRILLTGTIKAADVAKPPKPWNGVKLMIQTESPTGPGYFSPIDLAGTFDWRPASAPAFVPRDATAARIVLGVEDTTGTAWFKDVSVKITAVMRSRPATRPAFHPDRRINLPHLRGVMYGPNGKAEDIETLARWGGNLIRWQFYDYEATLPEKRLDLDAYDRWLDRTIAQVDQQLPLCEKLGIHVVIDLHTPPGFGTRDQWEIFSDPKYQRKFLAVWDKLVRHFKDQPAVWGYDIVNEPVEGKVAPGLLDWRALAETTAKQIRALDPKKAIIIEPGPFGGWGNLDFWEPIDVPGIVYSVHMYEPLFFTHQGVLDGFPRGPVYPGKIDGVEWNRDTIRKKLDEVRQWQLDYNVPIYVGEFSAIRWANGSADYIRDCISVFDEFGWDWSYHAFREWQGWNVEIEDQSPSDKPTPATQPTDRLKVLEAGFHAK